MFSGEVVYVSADTVEGEGQGERSYLTRIRIEDQELKKVPDFKPTPGMPVEVCVKTGEQTFWQYLVSPISDGFSRAFREN